MVCQMRIVLKANGRISPTKDKPDPDLPVESDQSTRSGYQRVTRSRTDGGPGISTNDKSGKNKASNDKRNEDKCDENDETEEIVDLSQSSQSGGEEDDVSYCI